MDVLQTARARHSYRKDFLSTPVPREHLTQILQAALTSPTGCNAQTTKFVAVDDPNKLAALSALTGQRYTATATAAILVFTKVTPTYKGNSYHVQDYAAAVQTILLALTELGYASCWVEGQIQENGIAQKMAQVVEAPADMELAVYLPLGVPAQAVAGVSKVAFDQRAWFNRYGQDA